jgi:DNA repair exonuclease SbcCD ATPase subunit
MAVPRPTGPVARAAEWAATTAYLQWLLPRAKLAAVAEADRSRLRAEASRQQTLCEQLQDDFTRASLRSAQQLAEAEAALLGQRRQLADQAADAQGHLEQLQRRCADFEADCTALRDHLRQSEHQSRTLRTALAALTSSPTMRLRRRLLRLPVLGRSLRLAARLVAAGSHQETAPCARHE